jgi:site-specific DNA-methyltransferase (adenine-specific)
MQALANELFCADAVALMKSWPSACVDACITDPPYNIARKKPGLAWAFSSHVTMHSDWDRFGDDDYNIFTYTWLSEVCRVTRKNGNIFIFGSYHNIYLIGALAQRLDLRIINSIIWAKPNAQPNITCRMFTESTEQIIWLCKRNFWTIPITPAREKKFGKHPSQKPMQLMERLVMLTTKPGDLVLDCFAGSGSTLLACQNQNRRFVGIERDPEYCALAKKRLDDCTN